MQRTPRRAYLHPDIDAMLHELAAEEGRTLSAMVVQLVLEHRRMRDVRRLMRELLGENL